MKLQESMSLGDLPECRKRPLSPITEDRAKRPRTIWDDGYSGNSGQKRPNCCPVDGDNAQGNKCTTQPFLQYTQQPTAKMVCGTAYDLNATVDVEITSAWQLRFKGSYAAFLTTLNHLSLLQTSLSGQPQ